MINTSSTDKIEQKLIIAKIYFCLVVMVLLFSNGLQAQDSEWKFKKEKEGIKVYLREIANSNIKELKMTTTMDASLSTLISALDDVEMYKEWVYRCADAKILKVINESEMIYYTKTDFPWPLSDRDVVTKATLSQDSVTKVITSFTKVYPNYFEEIDGVVRIPELEITWMFTPLSNGKVHLDYLLSSDPGGHIPAWAINLGIDQGPAQSIINFKKMLKKDKYKNKKLAYIQE